MKLQAPVAATCRYDLDEVHAASDHRQVRVGLFLLTTFAVSWLFGAATFLFRGDTSTTGLVARTGLGVAFMFGPLIGAVVARRASGKEVFKPLGTVMKVNGWWLVAWFGPYLYSFAALLCALSLPGIEWSPDLSGFWERMASVVPRDPLEESRRRMESIHPVVFWFLLVVRPLLAGLSVNAIAAFGEELGWRGFSMRGYTLDSGSPHCSLDSFGVCGTHP